MTTAIAAHASARPANQATSAAANAANTAIDASAAPTGDFATTLAAQQAGPVRISSPAATPGTDLPHPRLPRWTLRNPPHRLRQTRVESRPGPMDHPRPQPSRQSLTRHDPPRSCPNGTRC